MKFMTLVSRVYGILVASLLWFCGCVLFGFGNVKYRSI